MNFGDSRSSDSKKRTLLSRLNNSRFKSENKVLHCTGTGAGAIGSGG
jgi:hypothetical protein